MFMAQRIFLAITVHPLHPAVVAIYILCGCVCYTKGVLENIRIITSNSTYTFERMLALKSMSSRNKACLGLEDLVDERGQAEFNLS